MKAEEVVVEGEQNYKDIHGHAPRGVGFWMFSFRWKDDEDMRSYHGLRYSDAKVLARIASAAIGVRTIRLLP